MPYDIDFPALRQQSIVGEHQPYAASLHDRACGESHGPILAIGVDRFGADQLGGQAVRAMSTPVSTVLFLIFKISDSPCP